MDPLLPIVDPRIEEYLLRSAPARDPVLAEMEALAAARGFPIVGPLVGALLQVSARSIGARDVLELGSGFGYSAIWFARAVGPGGRVVATESSRENATLGEGFLSRADLADRVRYRVGNALEIARELEGPFDVVFNDIDKQDYPRILEVSDRLLRPGGLLISDNMLWHGSVTQERPDATTRGVRELTRLLYASPRYLTTLLPLRDGVTVSLRLE
jgi:predicted O-methyltransferase YrrM